MGVCRVNSGELSLPEFRELARGLESFHELFRALWTIGEPRFTESVDTAAIVFGPTGAPLRFLFNPQYWKELPAYDRQFVVCHEMLHAVLNHGFRSIGLEHHQVANVAADIVVNHLLVNKFGFTRELLRNWRALCWVDTVFTDPTKPLPSTKLTMEEYYDLCLSQSSVFLARLADEHRFEVGSEGSLRSARAAAEMDALLGDLDAATRAELLNRLGREAREHPGRADHPGGAWSAVRPKKPEPIRWDEHIRRRIGRRMQQTQSDGWVFPNRRRAGQEGLMMPGTMEATAASGHRLQRCVFFLDASGSTWEYRDRFFGIARSLPPRQFQVELCSFDTRVFPLDLKKPEVRGGGGTSFGILEAWLLARIDPVKRVSYPDVVIVLTDGDGDFVNPKHPERWHWLLTSANTGCIPNDSVVLRLESYV